MTRVKRGTQHNKKRKKLRKEAKGYKWNRKNSTRLAKTAVTKAGAHAYAHRRQKKRVMRRLWQTRLNAALRQLDWKYSRFIHALKENKIELDRKILSDMAVNQPKVFAKLVDKIKPTK